MRLRKIKNAGDRLLNNLGLFISNPEEYKGKWRELFNNNNPLEIIVDIIITIIIVGFSVAFTKLNPKKS